MTQTIYDLTAFTHDLDRIVDEHSADYAALVQNARPLVQELLTDMSWLDERATEPRGAGSVQYLLHRHPHNAYAIVAVVFPAGYSTTVHDHTTWGLIGVWRGDEQEERFVRTDDGSTEGRATFRTAGTVLNTPGSVTWLVPPDQEVHRISNLSPFPSLSIHIYGEDLDGKPRHQFDLETGEIKEFRTKAVVLD